MILISWGLLTLLAISNAGGDHIKGGGHITGGDYMKGAGSGIKSVPQALIQQKEVAPAVITKTSIPASVKAAPVEAITKKGAASFGLKTVQVPHELSGKIHRTAELHHAAVAPVAQVPVIQVADASDRGRVKGLKTVRASVPAVGKTSPIPAAAIVQTQNVKGLKTVAAATKGKTRFSVSDAQFREPVATPIVDQTVVAAIKTSPSIIPQKTIKSAETKLNQPNVFLTQQKLTSAITKGGSDVLPQAMQAQQFRYTGEGPQPELSGIGEARKVLITTPLVRNAEISTDIKLLNRQLMERQSEEELKRTLAGIVSADSDLGAITLSEAELSDISMRIGSNAMGTIVPDSQLIKPGQRPQARPVIPQPQQRIPQQLPRSRPATVGQRIPVAPKPQIIGGGVAPVRGFDQRVRYTGTRVTTSGVQGSGRIIPGQGIGGTSIIQGENMQFILGNAVGGFQPGSQWAAVPRPRVSPQAIPKPLVSTPSLPKPQDPAPILPQPGLSTDIFELNRQLMKKQSEQEIKQMLSGIARTDSNLGSIILSEAELTDLSRRVEGGTPKPAAPAPQQRRPEQLPKPALPAAPQRRPAVPAPQQRKPDAVRQRIPVAPKPQISGGVVGPVSGFDQRIRYTGTRVTSSGVQGSGRIIPGQGIGGTSVILGENVQYVVGNSVSTIGGRLPGNQRPVAPKPRVSSQAIPKPQMPAPALRKPEDVYPILSEAGLNANIIELNRQLMQKQNEEELRQALGGVLKGDIDINKISLSAAEISDISKSLPGRVSAPLSPDSVIPVTYIGTGVDGQRLPSVSRDASLQRYGSGMRSSSFAALRTSNAQLSLNAASKMQAMTHVQQKVGQESIEAPLELQQKIEPTLAVAQVEEPIVQTKVTQTVKAFQAPISQTVQKMLDTSDSSQLQMKVDDIIGQSQLSKPAVVEQMQLKRNIGLPSRKSKMVLDNLSQKYLQEKLPVDVPSYVPLPSFMSPFNYRVPHLQSPIVQQQERLDQILV